MPLLSSKPLMTTKNPTKVGTVASHVVGTVVVEPRLAGSVDIFDQPTNHIARRALSNMVPPEQTGTTAKILDESPQDKNFISTGEESQPSNVGLTAERHRVPMPSKHSRIPSTGNRATVMDVAQVLYAHSPEPEPSSEVNSMPAAANQLRNLIPSAVQMEKRKSNQEKYSAMMLPSLKEEPTPTTSPAGTISHAISDIRQQKLANKALGERDLVKLNDIGKVDASFMGVCFYRFSERYFNCR
jgi:hypothetical protein